MMKRTHVRDYVRSRHGTSDHGGKVSEHDRGYEPGVGIKEASEKAKSSYDIYNMTCPNCGTTFEASEKTSGKPPFDKECPNCGASVGSEYIVHTYEYSPPVQAKDKMSQFKTDLLSEAEVLLLKRRLNAGKIKPSDIPWPEEGYKLTPEQSQKGLDWLKDQWKTPYGVERKNNPFGYREQDVLEHFKEFKLIDFYDNVNYAQVQAGIHNYLPYYRVIATDGGTFEYYNDYTGIHILG